MKVVKQIFHYIWVFIKFIWTMIKYAFGTATSLVGICTSVISGFLAFAMVLTLACGAAGIFVYAKLRPDFEASRAVVYDKLSNMSVNTFERRSDTEVYDKDGNLIGLINAGHYEHVDITEISPYIQNEYIAVEDRRYKQHAGVDYVGVMRAFVALVRNSGEITQGGSTITQQVVKNTMLTQEQTFKRKMIEIMIAPYVDQRFGKDKVMEFYCNNNFYGNRCYGVQAASRYYFGKECKDLEVWEAAMLVGLSNNPSAYDPVNHPEAALEKRNRVLKQMLDEKYITKELYADAMEQPLTVVCASPEGTRENYQSSYAIHCAALELMKNEGFNFKYTFGNKAEYDEYREQYSELYQAKYDDIRMGGYQIYTSLDQDIQNVVQTNLDNILSRYKEVDENTGKYTMQGASVVVDNQTNYVVAIVGGRGTEDEYNRGYLSTRQPGSCIKPIIDYAPAFDTGLYTPSTVINDHLWEDGPENSGRYFGNITIREALNRSLNTVAWQVLQGIGVETGLEYLDKLHFMSLTYVDNGVESLSIGGFTNGVRVVDMAKAYSSLANEGVYNDRTCIRDIKFNDTSIYSDKSHNEVVYDSDTAYMVTDILKGTMDKEYATGYGLDIAGQEAAGKTGTTNNNKDAWFCGYTRYYTTAVWMGYDMPKPMPGVFGATYAGRIWQDIMSQLHKDLPVWDWEQPATVYLASYDEAGHEVNYDNGTRDMFSSKASIKAAETTALRAEQNQYESVLAQVEEYEGWFINTVEDAYIVDDKYNTLKTAASLVKNDDYRKELLQRIEDKYEVLSEDLKSWSTAIAEYEVNKAREEEVRREENARLAEENRKTVEKNQIIANFTNSLTDINNMQYLDTTAFLNYTNIASEKLRACIEYDEYDSLVAQYLDAINKYKELPTYNEWYIAEQARLEEERRRAEEEERQRAEQERIIQEQINGVVNPQPSTGPSGPVSSGPMGQTGPLDGPGVTNP